MMTIDVRRAPAVVLIALGLLAGGQPAHAQTPPPSLVRTLLAASESPTAATGDITVDYSCDMTVGGTFSVSYTASGTAAGPYPGTFLETGTVLGEVRTVDALGIFAQGVLTSWQAQFVIDSPVGEVTGTKRLADSTPGFTCFDGGFRGLPYDEETAAAGARVSYDAVLRTGASTFRDSGTATSEVAGVNCTNEAGSGIDYCADLEVEHLAEDFFLSDGVVPVQPGTPLPSTPPSSVHGKATGGGRVLSTTAQHDMVTVGFNVRSSQDRLQGSCNVVDLRADVHVRCLTVDSYAQVGTTAVWTGTAQVDGIVERYRITVQDDGEPNRTDTFRIHTGSYDVGGLVVDGNVQVHPATVR
jgi:hypothetical protein